MSEAISKEQTKRTGKAQELGITRQIKRMNRNAQGSHGGAGL